MPFHGLDFFDKWLEPSFTCAAARAHVVLPGADARDPGRDPRDRRDLHRVPALPTRARRSRHVPARRQARCRRRACSATRTTTTRASARLVGGPAARLRRASSTASSTPRSSTSTVDGVGHLVKRGGLDRPAPRAGRPGASHTHSVSRSAPSATAALRRRCGRGGSRWTSSRSSRRSSRCRSSARSCACSRPQRRPEIAKAVGYATSMITFGLAAWLLWQLHRAATPRGSSSSSNEKLDPDASASATSSASTASASSWWRSPRCCSRSGCSRRRRYITHRVKAYIAWFLLLEGAIMGIFLALDLILFFVFWELLLRSRCTSSSSDGAAGSVPARGHQVLPLHRVRLGVPACVDPRPRVHPPGRHRGAHLRLSGARQLERALGWHRGAALPRVHGGVRDQGAAVPVPHVVALGTHRSTHRGLGGAGRCDPEDGCLRRPALRLRALHRVPRCTSRPSSSRSR